MNFITMITRFIIEDDRSQTCLCAKSIAPASEAACVAEYEKLRGSVALLIRHEVVGSTFVGHVWCK